MTNQPMHDPSNWLAGGGEMGARTRAFDWAQTPVGPVERWPQSLKTAVSIMLTTQYPILIWWGRELIHFYNDAYLPVLGKRHPAALGRPGPEVWSEAWPLVGPQADAVMNEGRSYWNEELLIVMTRNGYPEEVYMTFSYGPIRDDAGQVGGVFCACTEETQRVLGRRRLSTLQALADRASAAETVEEACTIAAATLAENPHDLPFVLLYLLDADGQRLMLAGSVGVEGDLPSSPAVVALTDGDVLWPFQQVAATGASVEVPLTAAFGPLPGGAWPEPAQQAVVMPMTKPGQSQLAGFVVAGVSPRRPLDDGYRGFLGLVAGQVATAIANARAYEEEKRRAEALAELDRAKTAFFSNISHEFRTPLTLMVGPLEDSLAEDNLPPAAQERLTVAHRNSQRLLKLVNTLLDFSRIEAGRMEAVYAPVDLAAFTAELASVFRSAIERAGMTLTVDCPPLPEPVYVDRAMWEKIVLNLLSNAFKFTFAGEIAVRLRAVGDAVALTVRDTGTGIPDAELPHLFARFHRVKGARGRSYEGSGIGLALVQELVKLHGGTVGVTSTVEQGSTFTVTIPLGKAHLPTDRIEAARTLASTGLRTQTYVEEALRWLPEEKDEGGRMKDENEASVLASSFILHPSSFTARILLVDDNADMRAYVRRLLSGQYTVVAVADGEAALAVIQEQAFDLVLADVMMPRLDGFGLLKALRAAERTQTMPVILLSARAGEEARVEGLAAGADDYLVKPFSARELLARIEAHLKLARLRQAAADAERALRQEAELRAQAQEHLSIAVEAAQMGTWDLDLTSDFSVHRSLRHDQIFGYATPQDQWSQAIARQHVIEEDRATFDAAFARARETGELDFAVRIRWPDGSIHWLGVRGRFYFDAHRRPVRGAGVNFDITAAKGQERLQEFRLTLSDALRPLTDPLAIQRAAMQLVGEFLEVDRALYNEIRNDGETIHIEDNYVRGDLPKVTGDFPVRTFGAAMDVLRRGEVLVIEDQTTTPLKTPLEREASTVLGVFASATVPLIKAGGWVANFGVLHGRARQWTENEIVILQETAERTWDAVQRARVEEALRASEEKYRTLFDSIDEAFIINEMIFNDEGQAVDFRLVEANRVYERQTGLVGAVGKLQSELLPNLESYWMEGYARVAQTGEPWRAENFSVDLGRWYQAYVSRIGGAGSPLIAVVFDDITKRKRRELNAALLDEIGKDLSVLSTPDEVIEAVGTRLGEFLDASSCIFADVDEAKNEATIHHGWNAEHVPSLKQTFRLADYFGEEFARAGRAGETVIVRDTGHDERANAEAYARLQLGAFVTVPFQRHGRWTANITVTSREPRDWRAEEIELLQEIAARVFPRIERARAEETLRASEQRLRNVLDGMDEAFGLMDHDMRIITQNQAALQLDGRPLAEIRGRTHWEVYPGSEDTELGRLYKRALAKSVPVSLEHRYEWPGGGASWLDMRAYPVPEGLAVFWRDISERKQQEQRQAYLLKLSDTLRPLADPAEIQQAACRVLGEHTGASRVLYSDVYDEKEVVITNNYVNGVSPIIVRLNAEEFGLDLIAAYKRGERVIFSDAASDPRFTENERRNFAALDIAANVSLGLVKGGKWIAAFGMHNATPRKWTPLEITLLEETAEHTWAAVERARAEEALRVSEEKYRTLFDSIDEGYLLCDLILDPQGQMVDLDYVEANPAAIRMMGFDARGKRLSAVNPDAKYESYWYETWRIVAKTGNNERLELYAEPTQRWYDLFVSKLEPENADSHRVAVIFNDITERKRTEEALRKSEERQAFLLKLNDALRPLTDPIASQAVAARMLGTHLSVDRCYYAEFDWPKDVLYIHHEYTRTGAVSAIGAHPISLFNDLLVHSHKGEPLVCDDIMTHPVFGGEAAAYRARGTDAFILMPLVKQRTMVACMCVTMETARHWSPAEIELVEEAAERTWAAVERAKVEEALRASEARTRIALDAAQMATWEWHLSTGEVFWNEQHFLLFGMTPHDRPLTPADFFAHVHPDDRTWLGAMLQTAVDERRVFQAEFRSRQEDGSTRWMSGYGRVVAEEAGQATRMSGVMFDITERKAAEAALRESEARQAIILETMAEGVVTIDRAGCFFSANAAAERILGVARSELIGQSINTPPYRRFDLDGTSWSDRPVLAEIAAAGQHIFQHNYVIERRDGTRVVVARNITALRTTDDTLLGFVSTLSDITEQQRTETALRDSEARFRAVANLVPDLLWSNDVGGVTDWYNQRWLEYTGQTLAEAMRQGWLAMIHADDRPSALRNFQRAIEQGTRLRQEQRLRRADGEYRWFLVQVTPLFDQAEQIVRWFGAATDVHEQRLARELLERHVQERTSELTAVSAMRQQLLDRLLTAQEDERHRIARDLHDSLGQYLVTLNVGLKAVQEIDGFPPAVAVRIESLRAMVMQMDEEVERLAFALRPLALDDLGLADALRRHVDMWAVDSQITVDLHLRGQTDTRLPAAVETAIFRIVQEALTNIRKYAAASQVSLILEQRPHEVLTIIEDNGRGFDVATVMAEPGNRLHLGLTGMRERAALVGGRLEVESAPGGTTLYLHIPLSDNGGRATHE